MIEFKCSACGKRFAVPDTAAGKSGKCNACGSPVRVPIAPATQPAGIDPPRLAPVPPIVPTSTTTTTDSPRCPYTTSTLVPGERILYVAALHWSIWLLPALLVIPGLLITLISPGAGLACWIPLLVLVALATLARQRSTEMVVTNRRVVLKAGLLSRHTTELQVNKLENVSLSEPISDRLLGRGRVCVTGSGTSRVTFREVARPAELRMAILQASEVAAKG